jgi:predicted solute-binding protein
MECYPERLPSERPVVAAVSYLNTVPLIWGFLRGPLREAVRLELCVPSECARRVESGAADLGIVPVAEIARQGLTVVPGTGIACSGPVRSILLISKTAPGRIRRLAADSGSRTSVQLARIVLEERYGACPEIVEAEPDLASMLSSADGALLIGDSALRVDPDALSYTCLDLGREWMELTGLPMVFALWAGRAERVSALGPARLAGLFRDSLSYGLARLEEILSEESGRREFSRELVRAYLTRHIRFEISAAAELGLASFLDRISRSAFAKFGETA